MNADAVLPFEGARTWGAVCHLMTTKPMSVHCCHCRWCQRETGSAFALNTMIEADRVELLAGEVELVDTPSRSGNGQFIARYPACRVAVWSHCAGAGDAIRGYWPAESLEWRAALLAGKPRTLDK